MQRLVFQAGAAADCVIRIGRRFLRRAEAAAYAAPYDQSVTTTGYPAPAVIGAPARGVGLTAQPGSFSGGGLSYGFQWLRDGVAVPGAVGAAWQTGPGEVGATLACVVTATNRFGAASATTPGVVVVA